MTNFSKLKFQSEDLSIRSPGHPENLADLFTFARQLSTRTRELFAPFRWKDADLKDQFHHAINQSTLHNDALYLAFLAPLPVAYLALWSIKREDMALGKAVRIPTLGLAVADAYQDRGIGRICMQHLFKEAAKLGASGIELTTATDNGRAFYLYSDLGFKMAGRMWITLGGNPAELSPDKLATVEWRQEYHMYYPLIPAHTAAAMQVLHRRQLQAIERNLHF